MNEWKSVKRPGYFGRRRNEIVASFDKEYGIEKWRLVWAIENDEPQEFADACHIFYELSYLHYFQHSAEALDFVCSYGECIDNAMTNIQSGLDYTKQEAFSTHIQDIAVRNVLNKLGREFRGPKSKILVIRSPDSEGYRFGPGNIHFFAPSLIHQPSLRPPWANARSVEDFWQSNKWLQVKEI